ncbi:MAG: hypothetical protein GXP29_06985, partial [Planctomycetes bacterium]|nr:hypothetical protein [Planctomycetota bacterium]
MLSTARLFVCSVLTLAWASSPVRASEVESSRLSDDVFQSGLISYDLRDLLALHMQAMPDSGELPQLLLRRKMHLLVHESTLAGTEERREALAKANTILAEVIRNYSTDERAIEWQTTLARSLIYEQAEPYFSAILYRGGTAEDRRILADLMDQVFGVLSRLLSFLDSEYARIDELSISQYERLEKRGYIAQLETGIPQAQYMLLWSKFYMALALDSGDPQRRLLLDEVILKLSKETTLLTDKHATSHVQAQALLLAGMAHRRVADLPSAMRYLRDAQEVVGRITNSQERGDLQWVVTLGMVEHIRALRDAEKFDDATKKLANLRRRFNQTHRDDFGRKLLLANLESSIAQAIESPSGRFGRKSRTVRLSAKAVAPLIKLASKNLEYRADVYASMYERVSAASDPGLLHPFQQCALIAGHIAEAARLRQRSAADPSAPASQKFDADAMSKLEMAIEQATRFLKEQSGQDDENTCEVQFNLAVAEYHKGLQLAASQDFARVAETCPKFARSLSAAVYAVEIITQLVEDPSLRSRQDVQAVSIYALRTLVEGFEESDSARYWRFFLAQALEDSKQFEEAAKQYNLVDRLHAHHLTAQFRTIRCQILALRSLIERGEINTGEIHRRAGGARRAVTR